MPSEKWIERCKAQHVHYLEGAAPARFGVFGFILAWDGQSVYPLGAFEMCGEAAVYPPQTLNPTEESAILATATGLARQWDKTGVLTLRFAKQRDGDEYALISADEALSGAEAKHLLTLRGLWDGEGASFLRPGEKAPELLELPVIGVSAGETLYSAPDLRGALTQLPDAARAGFTGWYEKVLAI
jgi:hypothetical protein